MPPSPGGISRALFPDPDKDTTNETDGLKPFPDVKSLKSELETP